jgi:hypothetical protein
MIHARKATKKRSEIIKNTPKRKKLHQSSIINHKLCLPLRPLSIKAHNPGMPESGNDE